jgi:PAS domain S-box-containing protein
VADPISVDLLLVEDSAVDAELICDAVQQAGFRFRWRRVEDEAVFRAALDERLPDVILSDWTLPRFSGRAALVLARQCCPEVPFLYVTGTMAESCAIEALRQGANDYVYKHQLGMLAPALARVLAAAGERRSHREAEDQLRAVSEAAHDGIILMDDQGAIVRWNAAAERMFGYRRDEVIGSDLHRHIVPDRYRDDFRAAFPHFQATGQGRLMGITRELSALHRDGHEFPVEVALSAVRLQGRWHAVGIVRDITERRRTQAQLHQAQKMDAIGQLTGGIAHDFNNLLGVLIGNLDLARERLLEDHDGLELVDAALDAALRGAALNKRLLAFARRQSLQPEKVDVRDSLDDIVRLLKRALGERVDVRYVRDPGCGWPIKVDPSQFENALVNLGVNARDAMPDGGLLTIECRNVSADDAFVEGHIGMSPGDYVAISVSDTGCGMTPEVLARVFEPFFTTKEVGKGTGLGLSMVHGFVNQSGGHVSIYSEQGKGTTVRLYLPRCLDGEHPEPAGAAEEKVSPFAAVASLLVLAVDDNPGILKVTVRQLGDLGYRTAAAGNADEALALVGQGTTPDILFTDIVMPGSMDGLELAERLRAMIPDLPVLLCSGFTERAAIDARSREGRPITFPLLAKPFRKDELARALSALRENPEEGASNP